VISGNTRKAELGAAIELEDVVKMKLIAAEIYADPVICDYIMQIVEATHQAAQVQFGSSIRGGIGLTKLAKAWAAAKGRNYVSPDDVKALAIPVLAHRIILTPDAEFDGIRPEQIIEQILMEIPVPVFRK
jgi:MoxR-like ATPase